jgi:PhzF family phenazine biosynthesis protein
MGQTIIQVDAFTNKPFTGNPAAVCIMPGPGDEQWMQNVAKEMNLSETAFLYKEKNGYNLRWFTPTVEIDLCGHATLASAHVLWETGQLDKSEEAKFYTRSGLLKAQYKDGLIFIDLPAQIDNPIDPPADLTRALNVKAKYAGKNRFDYIIEVESESILRSLNPDFTLLKALPVRGVILTSLAESKDYDFVSRFFAPGSGIDEDPVTGSAHCCLGPFWKHRLKKNQFSAYQASPRGGSLSVHVEGDRVLLGGNAVTVLRGELVQ